MLGIGACSTALKRIGIDVEIVDAVEIDKYAIASFNAIHGTNFEVQDICEWDKDLKDIDLITHGSPCQDFSVAGKQAGGDIGSGTRSSLMYETIRIVGKIRPKYVLWENVKNLLSKKHKHNFDAYIETMNILGYNSYYQVLNAKDYGIPQNRERVYTISIRKDIDKGDFVFPEKEELKLRLKDMLENEVEEKYYLKDYQIENIKKSTFMTNQRRIQEKDYCDTLCARDWKDPKCVRIGGIFDTEKSKHQAGSIYDKEGLSPTLDAMQGGWRQPSIITEPKIITYSPYVNKKYEEFINEKGYIPEMFKPYNKKEIKNIAPTLTAQGDSVTKSGTILKKENCRIRKLTPKECWRLMGFSDEDFEKAAFTKETLYIEGGSMKCNAKLKVVKKKQRHIDTDTYVLCTTNNEIEQDYQEKIMKKLCIRKEMIEKTQNVNIAIELLEDVEQKECVINTTKCGDYTEMLCTLIKNLEQHHMAIIELEKVDSMSIEKYLKITSEENLNLVKSYIISILIKQIINSKIYGYINQKANIQGYIAITTDYKKNLMMMKLSNLKMEITTRLNSNTALYKQARQLNLCTSFRKNIY